MRLQIRRSSWQAFGTALSLETVAVGSLLAWWAMHPAPPPLRELPLEIEAPSPVQEPTPPPPKPAPTPPPAPAPQLRSHLPPPPAPVPVPQTVQTPEPAPAPAPAIPVAAPAMAPSPAVQPPPPPAPATTTPPSPSAEYTAKVHAAVQAVFNFPLAAQAAGFVGRARVHFALHGTTPVGARLVVSSGMGVCDREALREVQAASYPPSPPELKGADTEFDLWVEFRPHT